MSVMYKIIKSVEIFLSKSIVFQ